MPKRSPIRTEQDHHRRAFEIYCAQGAKRSFGKVAAELGVSVSSVKTWSVAFGWKQRLREREATAARQIADRAMANEGADTERNLRLVRAALMKLAKGIVDGSIKPRLDDLPRLVMLEEHLCGVGTGLCRDPTHRRLTQVATETDPERLTQTWLNHVLGFLKLMPDALPPLMKELSDRGLIPPTDAGTGIPATGL